MLIAIPSTRAPAELHSRLLRAREIDQLEQLVERRLVRRPPRRLAQLVADLESTVERGAAAVEQRLDRHQSVLRDLDGRRERLAR